MAMSTMWVEKLKPELEKLESRSKFDHSCHYDCEKKECGDNFGDFCSCTSLVQNSLESASGVLDALRDVLSVDQNKDVRQLAGAVALKLTTATTQTMFDMLVAKSVAQ